MAKNILLSIIKDPAIRGRVIMVLVVVVILAAAIVLSGPKPLEESGLTAEDNSVISTLSDNPSAETPNQENEYAAEYGITTGVIVGTAGIVLIILAGTVLELRRLSKS